VNYNQVTKAIKNTFTEKKALAFLYQLEKATRIYGVTSPLSNTTKDKQLNINVIFVLVSFLLSERD